MDKYQLSRNKMINTVSFVLNHYTEIVDETPGLKSLKTDLDNLRSEVDTHTQGQDDTGEEITINKNSLRKELNTSFRKVSSALVAYSVITQDPHEIALGIKHEYTDTDISKMLENDIVIKSYILYSDALPLGAKLTPFAQVSDIALLKTQADDYAYMLPQKRVKIVLSSLSTSNLKEAIDKIIELLENKIDKLVEGLRFIKPEFYKTYKNARIILDPAYRKRESKK